MLHTLTSDIAHKSLDVLLERAKQPRNGFRDDAQELLDNCEVPYLLIDRLWRSIQESLDRGTEKQRFMVPLKDCLDVIAQTAQTMTAVRERVQAATLTPQQKEAGLSLLDRLEQDAAKKRDELTALLRWLEMPRREIDPALIAVDTGERDAKGFIDHDEFMRRFLSGEDE